MRTLDLYLFPFPYLYLFLYLSVYPSIYIISPQQVRSIVPDLLAAIDRAAAAAAAAAAASPSTTTSNMQQPYGALELTAATAVNADAGQPAAVAGLPQGLRPMRGGSAVTGHLVLSGSVADNAGP